MAEKEYALIVAGGKGTRFSQKAPKQFTSLLDKPVILHTVEAFIRYDSTIQIVLVLPEDDLPVWEAICNKHNFSTPVIVQAGGVTRFQSVKRGLEKIGDEGYVAVHDGVRPLVTPDIIKASFAMAKVHHAAVAAVDAKDSIRMVPEGVDAATFPIVSSRSVDRNRFKLIQTPQTFRTTLIKQAYEEFSDELMTATDDASVAEAAGHAVHLFEGSYENIKITTPDDLLIARAIMAQRDQQTR